MKKIVFYLLMSGIVFAQNSSSLAEAVKKYDYGSVVKFLKNGADPNTLVDGDPAICFVAKIAATNTYWIFEELLKYGANPNSVDSKGNSVLSLILSTYNATGAIALIKHGADVNPINKTTIPPLLTAMSGQRVYPKSKEFSDLLKLMFEKKVDVNVQGPDGYSPLRLATSYNDVEMVKYLLELKADPNTKDIQWETPLYWAAYNGNLPIVELLLNAGADPNIVAKDKETALMKAASSGHKEVVLKLLEYGAKTNLKNSWKQTAQDIAKQNGHKEIVEILKKAGSKSK